MSIMKIRRVAIVIAVLCYIVSCTRPSDLDLPKHTPALVLHGYVQTGDTFRIALGRTFPSLGNAVKDSSTYVTNGWALLYEGNVFLDSLKYHPLRKLYISSRKAEAGKLYMLRAGAPGYTSIEAVSNAPFPVPSISVERKQGARRTISGNWLDDLSFTFQDPPAERNFYLASVHGRGSGLSCVYTYDPAVERYSTEAIPFEDGFCMDHDEILYNDKTFDGTLKRLTLSTGVGVLDSFRDGIGTVYRSYAKRYSVTEDYYRYFRGSHTYPLVEGGPSFAQVLGTKGNVKNGHGLFTIFSVVTDTIR